MRLLFAMDNRHQWTSDMNIELIKCWLLSQYHCRKENVKSFQLWLDAWDMYICMYVATVYMLAHTHLHN